MTSNDLIIIYSDGACSGNPGPGGWGAVLTYKQHEKEISGGEEETTNNRMELMAAIEALRTIHEPASIVIYTDSNYVKDGITKWIHGWKQKNWKTANGKDVKNKDLWQSLEEESNRHTQVEWKWVKGHAGDPMNERADQLARNAIPTHS